MNALLAGLPRQAWFYASLAILCWATVATAFKLALDQIDFLSLVFWSSIFSTITLFLIARQSQRLAQFQLWQQKDILASIGLGALNPAIYYLLLFKAYSLLAAQQAQVLNFIWPMVLTLLSVLFYKEKLNHWAWLAMLLSFSGVTLIAISGRGLALGDVSLMGVILALASAVFWAAYWLLNRNDTQDVVLRLLLNFAFGSLWVGILISLTNGWHWPSLNGLLGATYIALFEMSLAFLFWLKALKAAPNTAQLSNLIFITPFLSLLVIALVLGEQIQTTTWLGLGLIIAGIVLQRRLWPQST